MKINSFSVGSAPNHNEDFLEYVNMGIDGYAVVMADGLFGTEHTRVVKFMISYASLWLSEINFDGTT